MLSSEQNWHDVNASAPNLRYNFRAPRDVNLDLSRSSAGVKVLSGRSRARRVKMMSVGVLRRERVREKIFGGGARGLNGRLSSRKKRVVEKRTFRAREVIDGRGRGDGRCVIAVRKLRSRLIARGIRTGAKKMSSDLMLHAVSQKQSSRVGRRNTYAENEIPMSAIFQSRGGCPEAFCRADLLQLEFRNGNRTRDTKSAGRGACSARHSVYLLLLALLSLILHGS